MDDDLLGGRLLGTAELLKIADEDRGRSAAATEDDEACEAVEDEGIVW